jgi:hypothetical protein
MSRRDQPDGAGTADAGASATGARCLEGPASRFGTGGLTAATFAMPRRYPASPERARK